MDKNMRDATAGLFDVTEPDCEPLTEREASHILAVALSKLTCGAEESNSSAEIAAGAGNGEAAESPARVRTAGRKRRAGPVGCGAAGKKRGGRISLIAGAAVLVFGVSVFASALIDRDSPLLALFAPEGRTLTESELQLAQASGTVIDQTAEKDGMKVHVKEAIGDRDNVYLLFDVTLSDGTAEPGARYMFERQLLRDMTLSPTSVIGSDSWGEPSEDGTIPFTMLINAADGAPGKTFTLELEDLNRITGGEVDEPVAEGVWEVTFKLDYTDNSKDLGMEGDVSINGVTYRLNDVRISPLSLSYTLARQSDEAGKTEEDFSFLDNMREFPVVIKLRDGREYNFTEGEGVVEGPYRHIGNSVWRSINGNGFRNNIVFPHIMDPAEIESVRLGDREAGL
jgi:hypothetical protein